MTERTIHEGRNVKRIREMLGIKQEALAAELNWSQQKISLLEQKENIDDDVLNEVAKILKVPVEAIKNFDEERALNIISHNTFENCNQPASIFYNSTINPIEQWMQALEENKKLYERLLQAEKEKVALLEKILDSKK
jgi:transcriptional regulator with XRE-family HTH domain